MEKITATRRGSKGKNPPGDIDAGKGQSLPADDAGNRHSGEAGPAAPADFGGSRKGLAWAEVEKLVRGRHSHEHQIATVWHEAPGAELIDTPHGNIRVLTGPSGYQVASGEKVEL